jgi:hypothetical protein
MGRSFLVVAPSSPRSQTVQYAATSMMHGKWWYESDLNAAKKQVVDVVAKMHRLDMGGQGPSIEVVTEDAMPKAAEDSTDTLRLFAQATAEARGLKDGEYRWEYHLYETDSVVFPVLVIWTPSERDGKSAGMVVDHTSFSFKVGRAIARLLGRK